MKRNLMVDWKNVVAPIVAAAITVVGGFIVTFIASVLFKPDISMELMPDKQNTHKVDINMNNMGLASAEDVKLTLESPHNITSVNIFSTENYTKRFANSSRILEVNIPRFVQGEGSVIRISALIDPMSEITKNDYYIVYSTYDQGSKMDREPILSSGEPKTEKQSSDLFEFVNSLSPLLAIITTVGGIAGGIVALIQSLRRR